MADTIIHIKCIQCDGTGEFSQGGGTDQTTHPCNWPGCVDGYIATGLLEFDLEGKVNDILDKVKDVLEKVNE